MSEKIIDIHLHPLLTLITERELLNELRRAKVDLGVLLALDVDPRDPDRPEIRNTILERCLDLYVRDAPRVIEEIKELLHGVKTENEMIATLVKRHPQNLVGFGSINLSKSHGYVEEKISVLGLNAEKLLGL